MKLLTAKEERELFEALKAGNEKAHEQILLHNIGLVYNIVKKYKVSTAEKEDLLQEGMLALFEAINKFDLSLKNRFSTFAYPMVQGRIRNFIRDNGSLIKIPARQKEKINKIYEIQNHLTITFDRSPTYKEIADFLGTDAKEVEKLLALAESINVVYLETPITESGDELINILPDTLTITPEEELINREPINLSCYNLTNKEKTFLKLAAGIEDGIAKRPSEIAKIVGTSRQNVSNALGRARIKIKKQWKK